MTRARLMLAATLVGAVVSAGAVSAQDNQAPFQPILSGKSFTPPLRGTGEIEYTRPASRRDKDNVIIRIDVKNVSNAPLARLTIDETWYDKGGATISGGKGVIRGLLQPGEIQTVTISMPYNARLNGDKMQLSHAFGSINGKVVPKLPAPEKK